MAENFFEKFKEKCPCKSAFQEFDGPYKTVTKYDCRIYGDGLYIRCKEENCPFMAFERVLQEKML